jgi:hypothetical protein
MRQAKGLEFFVRINGFGQILRGGKRGDYSIIMICPGARSGDAGKVGELAERLKAAVC